MNPTQSCNCDISEGKWNSDEGFYISPNSLGITQMVFLQQKDLEEDALGRITLGPLECVETSMYLTIINLLAISIVPIDTFSVTLYSTGSTKVQLTSQIKI